MAGVFLQGHDWVVGSRMVQTLARVLAKSGFSGVVVVEIVVVAFVVVGGTVRMNPGGDQVEHNWGLVPTLY